MAGRANACVRLDKGEVACWGANENGVAGDGTALDPLDQGGVVGLPHQATSICVGARHACAALDDGTVWCWGDNGAGQIGAGAPVPAGARTAVRVTGSPSFGDVAQVACGDAHTCARTGTGTVWCWGDNSSGQNGAPPSTTPQPAPLQLPSLPPVIDLAAGMATTCAVVDGPEVRCWGEGSQGAFGTSRPEEDSASPIPVTLAEAPVRVAVGGGHVCAATASGSVWCWGTNEHGETGTSGLGINAPTPVTISGVTGVTAGASHSCAWNAEGALACWGSNMHGELALPPGDEVREVPSPIAGITSGAAAGESFTCAIRAGVVECWGMNRSHTLARGTPPFVAAPKQVAGATGVTEVVLGASHTCFVAAGTTRCCGANDSGQVGNGGAPRDEALPTLAAGAPMGLFGLGAGLATTCARTAEGMLWCWGANESSQGASDEPEALVTPALAPTTGAYEEIAGGRATTCGRRGGSIECWGAGDRGQLGDGSTTVSRATPSRVAGIAAASALALGSDHACAIDDGVVKCWGVGGDGRLGPSDTGDEHAPIALGIDDAIALGAYGTRTCVVRSGGAGVWCWGAGSPTPQLVPGSEAATQVTLGVAHACFLAAGTVSCWGSNRAGQLGDGTRIDRTEPVPVDLGGVDAVRAGAEHTCAVAGIDLHCWGATGGGRICDGTLVRDELPQPIAGSTP